MFGPALAAAAVLAAPLSIAPLQAASRNAADAARDKGTAELQELTAGRVAGKPTRCISQTSVTSSYVIPGQAIVYRIGSRTYLNRPQSGADTLRRDDVLLTRNIGTNLCRTDSVRLIDRNSRFVRGFVVLGDFVPYTKPKG